MNKPNRTLVLWQQLAGMPLGKWLFTRLMCWKAPYFASIRPRFMELQSGCCRVFVKKRRSVLNHIGTVHAIAMCNAAELAAGVMTQVTVPPTVRWIPKGMVVEYLKPAATDVTAVARAAPEMTVASASEFAVTVEVNDSADTVVFRAVITMHLSLKPK